jgi:hypothetical protein
MKTITQEAIKNYLLENPSKRLQICKEINSHRNSMDFVETTTIQELAETMDAYTLAGAIIYGDVKNLDLPVKFDGYANLKSIYICDLEDESENYIQEIINYIDDYGFQYINNIDLENLYDDYESEV